ncbi:MAG: phospholipase A [Campylobacter sp.]|nr:phospholipase A [Campylobacter sp.]
MKKFICLIIGLGVILMADESLELFQKGEEFEKNGDLAKAMIYYKLAAKTSLDIALSDSELKTVLSQNISVEQIYQNDAVTITKLDFSSSDNIVDKTPPPVENRVYSTSQKTEEETNDNFLGLRFYEPMYFAYSYDINDKSDRKSNETKFQISFKKPIIEDLLGFDEMYYFGYTQTSWWQVTEDSSPFRETNYRPEIFVDVPTDYGYMDKVTLGFLHESNGEDGIESRSWNKVYAGLNFKFGNFEINPRIWHSFGLDKYNENIRNYMGYGDLKLKYKLYKHEFSALLRNNFNFDDNHGAFEFVWMYPIYNGFNIYAQYFTGYGESLADYDKSVDKISIGVAITK